MCLRIAITILLICAHCSVQCYVNEKLYSFVEFPWNCTGVCLYRMANHLHSQQNYRISSVKREPLWNQRRRNIQRITIFIEKPSRRFHASLLPIWWSVMECKEVWSKRRRVQQCQQIFNLKVQWDIFSFISLSHLLYEKKKNVNSFRRVCFSVVCSTR